MSGPSPAGPAEWVALALICASAALAALLELMFLARFYLGSVIVPVVILVALVGNVVLPRWGFRIMGTAKGAVLPVAAWLLTLLGLSLYTRPEGDLFVIAAYGQQYAFYGLLLGGSLVGFVTVVTTGAGVIGPRRYPPAPTARPTPRGPSKAKGSRLSR